MDKKQLHYVQYNIKCCKNCKSYLILSSKCKIIDTQDNQVQELSICDRWEGK